MQYGTGCDEGNGSATSRSALYESLRISGLRFWMLVNVAGIDFEGLFSERTRHEISIIVRLNVEGTLDMTHGMLDLRDPLQAFHIINVVSLAAFQPMPVKATYATSKRFVLDFSLALRAELRSLGATVTMLCPAGLPTTPEVVEAIEAQGWMGLVTTRDVGAVAVETINVALGGKAVVIPGAVNRLIHFLGGLLPVSLVVSLVASRWMGAHEKRDRMPHEAAAARRYGSPAHGSGARLR